MQDGYATKFLPSFVVNFILARRPRPPLTLPLTLTLALTLAVTPAFEELEVGSGSRMAPPLALVAFFPKSRAAERPVSTNKANDRREVRCAPVMRLGRVQGTLGYPGIWSYSARYPCICPTKRDLVFFRLPSDGVQRDCDLNKMMKQQKTRTNRI